MNHYQNLVIDTELSVLFPRQATLFLVAGYDTTSNTLAAAMFELARHPELQQKLYDQIMSKVDQHVSFQEFSGNSRLPKRSNDHCQ